MIVVYCDITLCDYFIEFYYSDKHWGPQGFDAYWPMQSNHSMWLVPQVGWEVND